MCIVVERVASIWIVVLVDVVIYAVEALSRHAEDVEECRGVKTGL